MTPHLTIPVSSGSSVGASSQRYWARTDSRRLVARWSFLWRQ